MWLIIVFGPIFLVGIEAANSKPCSQKTYPAYDKRITCVCNGTYCDEADPIGNLSTYEAAVYTTSISGKRFDRVAVKFDQNTAPVTIKITPNDSVAKQTILGFGGAFTDAAGISMSNLSQLAQEQIMRQYFDPTNGIGYTVARTPMASCDFSTHNYTYDEFVDDFNLTHFNLTMEDFYYKIPYIQMANKFSGNQLKLFASPWTAPAWMKTNNDDEHGGTIKGDIATGPYWKTWANYFVRYFEEYSKNNITFWGVTMQNEPQADQNFQSLVLNSTQERDFTKLIWGPTLRSNSITKNLKLMVLDHNRDLIPDFVPTIFGDPDATSLLDGLAVHWYMDTSYGTYGNVAPGILTWAHDNYLGPKNKFLLYTEACNEGRPAMGLWLHGDKYMNDIINSLNNWAVGWVEWNLVVDPTGGPNWVNNDVDQSIIAFNSSYDGNGERFEKQPMFYAMGHFSKFIVPNSTIIDHKLEGTTYADSVLAISAQRPDGLKVVVINNRDLMPHNVSVINKWGAPLNLMLEPQSWTTIVYNDTVSLGSSGSTSSGTVQRLPSFWGLLGFLSVLFLSK